jgi:hypothetical protein
VLINLTEGVVKEILEQNLESTKTLVKCDDGEHQAIGYHHFVGFPQAGDRVVLNTTAVDLGLGTGGFHFIVHNKSQPWPGHANGDGHIMKLRYTPLQFSVLSVEEEGSPFRSLLEKQSSLAKMPVVVGLLHSHLTPAVLALNWAGGGNLRIAYLMTDGGALPISFSKQVQSLKEKKLLAGTITVGQAFGGDLEAVNYYSGLLAAKAVLKADITVVAMGPGIVGTNSAYGFSGVEQGQVVNAVSTLGGQPVIIPRLSFADPRPRHHGLSHHSRTILKTIILTGGWVGLPDLENRKRELIQQQITSAGLEAKYIFVEKNAAPLAVELAKYGLKVSTMGRTYSQDAEFFGAAWASGLVAYDLWKGLNEGGN